jgi:hypothetical protein
MSVKRHVLVVKQACTRAAEHPAMMGRRKIRLLYLVSRDALFTVLIFRTQPLVTWLGNGTACASVGAMWSCIIRRDGNEEVVEGIARYGNRGDNGR